jgi:eukaryotic-like serine/threonine-protein kinase
MKRILPQELVANRFEVRDRLGAGGMGVVYSAWDRERETLIALKALERVELATLVRFKREFRALRELHHPNIVELDELFHDGDRWFFTMEYVAGTNFQSWTRPGGVLDEQRLRHALIQLCVGVDAIHAAGKVHRDIKSSNVQVTPGGRVVLLDFGLAMDLGRQISESDRAGTPGYMAPEQIDGRGVGPWSDWYAVGVLLHEVLSGYDAASASETVTEEPVAASSTRSPDPPALASPQLDLHQLSVELRQLDPKARPSGAQILERLGQQANDRRVRPLVARQDALQELAAIYERVSRGDVAAVLVQGAAGVGKTALVRHFRERISQQKGALVLYGCCSSRESFGFRGIDEAMDDLAQELATSPPVDLERLLPRQQLEVLAERFPSLARLDPLARTEAGRGAPPQEVRAALLDVLVRVSRRRPVVLILDDVHWADTECRRVLEVLTSPPADLRGSGARILLVTAIRRGLSDRPLPELVSGLPVVKLNALEPEDGAALADWLLRAHITAKMVRDEAAATIAEDSGGVPRLIEVLARATLDRATAHEARSSAKPPAPASEPPAPASEPCVRKTILIAMREAARDQWGAQGLSDLAERMPEDVARDTLGAFGIAALWLPERYVMAWYEAVWEGPAQRQSAAFRRFLDCMMDRGFGRVRRFMLSLVTPAQLLARAPGLWRHDHTHGELTCDIAEGGAVLTLRHHAYLATPLSRLAIAEIYRYAVSLSRTSSVVEQHAMSGGVLNVTLKWF